MTAEAEVIKGDRFDLSNPSLETQAKIIGEGSYRHRKRQRMASQACWENTFGYKIFRLLSHKVLASFPVMMVGRNGPP
jgi:hypothetical protein